jgi:hypothetical protein
LKWQNLGYPKTTKEKHRLRQANAKIIKQRALAMQ